MNPLHVGAIALVAICAATSATAATTSASCVISSSVDITPSCLEIGVPTFDPQLGELTSVTLTSTLKGWGVFGLIDRRPDPSLPATAELTASIQGAAIFRSANSFLNFFDSHAETAVFQRPVGGSEPGPTYFWDWTLESTDSTTLTDAASLAALSQTADLFYPISGGGFAEGVVSSFPGPFDDVSQSSHHYVLEVSFNYAAVPEPSAWATMIIGFGLAGAALRRRYSTRFALTACWSPTFIL